MRNFKEFLFFNIMLLPGLLAFPQTAVFNLYQFTEPAGWKPEFRQGMVIYSEVDQNEGSFGQIGIYASRSSTNDAGNEFINDWKELVISRFVVPGTPKISIVKVDSYWNKAEATVQSSRNGQNFTLRMVNFTGLGYTATIITTFVGEKYKLKVNEFISSVKMSGQENIQSAIGQEYKKINVAADNNPVTQATSVSSGSSATGRRLSYGNLTYILPAGWKQQVKTNYLSVVPAVLFQGEAIEIRILSPLNTRDFQAGAAASWQEIGSLWNEGFYNDLFPGQVRNSSFGQYYYERKNTRRQNGLDTEIDLYLIADGNQINRCIVICNEFRVQGIDYFARTRFFSDINSFVFSIGVPGKTVESINIPSLEGGGKITGVWTGMAGGFSGYTGTYDQKLFYAVFYNNGLVWFCDRLPERGLYELNPLVWQNVFPDYWCTYSISGDRGIIKSSYYSDMPFVLSGGKLIITKRGLDHSFVKLASPEGLKLKGTWAFGYGESITFSTDGTFSDNGALSVLEHSLYYKPYTITANPGSGKYEFRNFTAIFTYSDGREFRCSFPGFDVNRNNPSPGTLLFGKDDILRIR